MDEEFALLLPAEAEARGAWDLDALDDAPIYTSDEGAE